MLWIYVSSGVILLFVMGFAALGLWALGFEDPMERHYRKYQFYYGDKLEKEKL